MRVSVLLCIPFLLAACSVKEERMECPTYVTVHTPTEADCLVTFYAPDGSLLERTRLTAAEVSSGDNATPVPRGDFYVSLVHDLPDMTGEERCVRCLPGGESSPLYATCGLYTVVCDDYVVTEPLHKQYARVHVTFVDVDGSGDNPYDIRVVAPSNGLDLMTLDPSEGRFACGLTLDGHLSAEFNLLRQREGDAILLEFHDPATAELWNTIRLSDFIDRTGYRWDAVELPDIRVLVDCLRASVTISVSGWEEPQTFTFTI